ncbi:MAG: T9SS type A sorting domain-containing protein [Chlorobi bacterium]|nr:T9SS type A sorting domain-containing protein [Chlorobiota bacterium]
MKFILLFGAIFIANLTSVMSQDITITFSATGESTTVDEITATNLATNESTTIPGGESLILTENTTWIKESSVSDRISISPNPFGNIAQIHYNNTKEQLITLKLTSVSGKIILSYQENLPAGTHMFSIAADKPGLYILSVISGNEIQSVKIIQKQTGNSTLVHSGIHPPINNTQNLKSALAYTLAYTPGDVISYEIKSGSNITIINDSPSESKNVEAEIVTCKDYDGTSYKVVKIGTQTWMAENLRSAHYPNGDQIPLIVDDASWANLTDDNTSDGHCVSSEANGAYGALYTYAAAIADNWARDNADNQGICPDNWHLPSDDEWTTLTDYLGGAQYAGSKMKETGTIHWLSPNTGATNSTGFNALPGGIRDYENGLFKLAGESGHFWCSREISSLGSAYRRILYYNSENVNDVYDAKSMGVSVRCVKD